MESFLNDTSIVDEESAILSLPLIRQPTHLLIIYCVAYSIIFIIGLAGNAFVVISVALNISMRNITNYLITNLAIADLLIIILNLPATLASNIFYEWWLGDVMCRLSVWATGATVSASVYTLVAVSADRYCAICHTMRYSVVSKSRTVFVIIPIWIVSGALFSPWLVYFKQMTFRENSTEATICFSDFPSQESERFFFLVVNILIAYFIPLIAITVFYVFIYSSFVSRSTLAVDKHAQERESRTKMKITKMMLVVVILFAASWAPLYTLYLDHYFVRYFSDSELFPVLRPIFQWLSLSNSCINPILYAYFSRRFRRAFQEILVMPCRQRYQQFKSYTANTSRRMMSTVRESRTFDFSGLHIAGGSSKRPSTAFSFFNGSLKRSSIWSAFSKRPSAAPSVAASLPEEPDTVYIDDRTDLSRVSSRRRRTSSGKALGSGRRRSGGFRRRDLHPNDAAAAGSGSLSRRPSSAMSGRIHSEETPMIEDPSTPRSNSYFYDRPSTSASIDKTDFMITVFDASERDSPMVHRVLSQRRSNEERRAIAKLRNGNATAVLIPQFKSVYL